MLESPSEDKTTTEPKLDLHLIFNDQSSPVLCGIGSNIPSKITIIHPVALNKLVLNRKIRNLLFFILLILEWRCIPWQRALQFACILCLTNKYIQIYSIPVLSLHYYFMSPKGRIHHCSQVLSSSAL